MKKLMIACSAVAVLFAGVAHADVISDRQAIMKQKNGASMGALAKMVKGEVDYDPAAAMAAFKTMREGITNFADLFPADSMQGGDTTASPKIWEDMDGFKAAIAKFEGDLDAAISANPQDKAAFMPVFGAVAGNCKSCHETYRVMKN